MKDFLNGITNPELIWVPILVWLIIAIILIRLGWQKNWNFFKLWLPLTLIASFIPFLMIIYVCPVAGTGDMAPLCTPFLLYFIVAEGILISFIVVVVRFLKRRKGKI